MNLKTLLKALILSCLLVVLSCSPQEEGSEDFGPQSSSDEVNDELTKGLGGVNVLSMQLGDFIHRIETSEFTTSEGVQEILTAELGYNVIDVETIDTIRRYTLVREIIDYTQEEVQKNTFESEIEFDLSEFVETNFLSGYLAPNNLKSLKVLETGTQKAKQLFLSTKQKSKPLKPLSENEIQVTYHNLASQELELDVPERVLERDQCGGIPTCKINVLYVTYDEILSDGESTERYRNEYYFSNDIPFSPFDGELNLLKQCLTGIGKVGSSRLLVKQCTSVVDFRHGAPEEGPDPESISSN